MQKVSVKKDANLQRSMPAQDGGHAYLSWQTSPTVDASGSNRLPALTLCNHASPKSRFLTFLIASSVPGRAPKCKYGHCIIQHTLEFECARYRQQAGTGPGSPTAAICVTI